MIKEISSLIYLFDTIMMINALTIMGDDRLYDDREGTVFS